MKAIDVIGIGAINFDYIFGHKASRAFGRPLQAEGGSEHLNHNDDDVVSEITKRIHQSGTFGTDVGGSGYRAIKTISCLDFGLRTAYVGTYALPQKIDTQAGLRFDPKTEFSHLATTEWLFETKGTPGRALVKLSRGLRHSIEIGAGVNTTLRASVLDREQRLRSNGRHERDSVEPFTAFLAASRWVHLTSFSDFDQFEFFVERVKEAKRLNRSLRFSIDPGDQYTRMDRHRLANSFEAADIIFLSEQEFNNVAGGRDFTWRSRVNNLGVLTSGKSSKLSTQVLIVKYPNRHILLNYFSGTPLRRTYWHPLLWRPQIRDDTGAGDVFAGGFIAGLLSPFLLSHQPAPIQLGARLAAAKLRSQQFPRRELEAAARDFVESGQRNEHNNFRQRVQAFFETTYPIVLSCAISFFMGLAVALLFGQ